MGLRINTNAGSLAAQRSLTNNQRALNNNLRKLSSGYRITRASDDAAGLAISEKLRADIRSNRQAKRNAGDGISMIQTAEGAISEISNIIVRLRELAVQSATDTLSDNERSFSDIEFQQLTDEIERISQSTSFNGKTLLNGSAGLLEFQIGGKNDPNLDRLQFDFSQANTSVFSLGIGGFSIGQKLGAQNALSGLDQALTQVNGVRAKMGAFQNRMESIITNLSIADENLSEANSRVRDLDIAQETAEMAKNNILVQSGASVLSQSNATPGVALKLLS